ncbi:transposase family protein [Streptomyces sp. NPDC001817]|uniref:transposase family protein n=1 Tax=Streptomyces sp. NPDC001817 TaxID=3154398 RepID=UPI00332BCEA3
MLWTAFSHLKSVAVEEITVDGEAVAITARSVSREAPCPGCGRTSSRIHGRYHRRLAGLAVAGRKVVIDLLVRRFLRRAGGRADRAVRASHTGLAPDAGEARAGASRAPRRVVSLWRRLNARCSVAVVVVGHCSSPYRQVRAFCCAGCDQGDHCGSAWCGPGSTERQMHGQRDREVVQRREGLRFHPAGRRRPGCLRTLLQHQLFRLP